MRFEKGHKAVTRQRIVDVAAETFRRRGIEAVGIAGLMAEAGLTHGGFYAHFASKEELVRTALQAAREQTASRVAYAAADDAGLEGLIRFYLRPVHRDSPGRGCAIAALAAEIARHEPATRDVLGEHVEAFLARIMARLPDGKSPAAARGTAIGILGVLLGALQLARLVTDEEASNGILEGGIAAALKLAV